MIPFDLAVAFVAGALLSLGAKEQLRNEKSLFYNKPLVYSMLWMTFVYTPSAMFFYHGWPDWNVMYVFDSSKNLLLSALLIRIDAMALISVFFLSFIVGHIQIRKGNERSVMVSMVVALIVLGAILLGLYNRSFFVAPYDQWLRGEGEWLFTSLVFYSNIVAAFTDLGPLAYLYLRFRREGQKLGKS
jgi:hypothetical protein